MGHCFPCLLELFTVSEAGHHVSSFSPQVPPTAKRTMPVEALAAATIAIFSVLVLPCIYLIFRHGFRHFAFLGWLFLFAFCNLKLVGAGMILGGGDKSTANLLVSIGLSPLLLAVGGILHEACVPLSIHFLPPFALIVFSTTKYLF